MHALARMHARTHPLSLLSSDVNPSILFKEFVKKQFNGQKFIAHCEETDKKTLKSVIKANEVCTILIGPEGDFSVKEIEIALEKQFIPISLGNTRLRTETAAWWLVIRWF